MPFQLSEFESCFGGDKIAGIVSLARTAEATERYEDMCVVMKALVDESVAAGRPISVEERNLLSVAFKNVIGTCRASWRTLSAEIEEGGDNQDALKIYKTQVETELKATCEEVIELLNKLLEIDSDDVEPKVFYLKMAGDYYRYLAESSTDNEQAGKTAADYYSKADKIATEGLSETHPIRLGLALNYSVCYYEILKEPKKACELAKRAFDDAISKLDKLEESDYKDSTLIMQLLRDNLTLWTSTDQDSVHVEDLSDEEN